MLLGWGCEVDNLPQKAPVIANVTVTDITESTAKCTFSITPIGATIKAGVIYDTSQTFQTGAPEVSTTNFGDGTVTLELTGLNSNTNYYCKPYIMDSQGSFIYADILSFNTQNALALSTSRITSSYMAGNHPLNITASSTWTVTSSHPWCTVQPQSGTGNREITVSLTENTTDALRTATLTVTSGNQSRQVTVEQDTKGSTVFNNNIVAAPSFGGGDGTQGDPYLIYNAQHLKKLVDDVNISRKDYANTCFKLMTDIEVTADEWIPIGYGDFNNSNSSFRGNFEGNGHTISGTLKSDKYIVFGFIGQLNGNALISNLTIAATVKNEGYFASTSSSVQTHTGAIAGTGWNENVIISNCHITGTVTGGVANFSSTGGVLGSGSATIQNCDISRNITGGSAADILITNDDGSSWINGSAYTGGIVGWGGGEITNCTVFNSATIIGNVCKTPSTGGIAGWNTARIYDCTNHANVTGDSNTGNSNTGGIVGANYGEINNCTNTSTVTGGTNSFIGAHTGGIAGVNENYIINCTVSAIGMVVGGGGGANVTGGIAGTNDRSNGNITNCTNNATVSGSYLVGGLVGSNDGEIHTSLNTGNITGADFDGSYHTGGLAGENSYNVYTHIYSCCTNRGTVNGQAANTNNQIGNGKDVEPCPDGHTKR